MDVAVRELKARLSAYLRRAAAGEHITVTDRGKPIAMLGPLTGAVDLDAAAEAGWLTRGSASSLKPVSRHPPRRSVQEVLDEDRRE
jgi:prevent-host-death family protein